jgi:hypothetical protein
VVEYGDGEGDEDHDDGMVVGVFGAFEGVVSRRWVKWVVSTGMRDRASRSDGKLFNAKGNRLGLFFLMINEEDGMQWGTFVGATFVDLPFLLSGCRARRKRVLWICVILMIPERV